MNQTVLNALDYITKNFTQIELTLIDVLIAVYFIYGIVLAADASKRYKNVLSPVIVFFGWVFGSIIFLPIYLSIRPDQGAKDRVDVQTQKEALLLGSGLDSCPHCGSVVERFYLYCRTCGQPVIKHCEFCGETLAFHWDHCIKCGKKQNPALIQSPRKIRKLLTPPLKKFNTLNILNFKNSKDKAVKELKKIAETIEQPQQTPAITETTTENNTDVPLEAATESKSVGSEPIKTEESKPEAQDSGSTEISKSEKSEHDIPLEKAEEPTTESSKDEDTKTEDTDSKEAEIKDAEKSEPEQQKEEHHDEQPQEEKKGEQESNDNNQSTEKNDSSDSNGNNN